MKKIFFIITIFLFTLSFLKAQEQNPIKDTPAKLRINSYEKRIEMSNKSLVKEVRFRSIGPSVMSGRIVDIAVSPKNQTHFYVAYASGGLWETKNNGISFTPIFDNEPSITIGAIAVDWQNNIIYVGTGENNSSRSSYAGTGIYKSTNDGKTWISLGLEETQHIGRIVIDLKNPNIIWVAAIGHLYSPNKERGVFKTTDAGKTWVKTLYIDNNTGAIDLVVNPKNTNELYAAMWHRIRRAWNFIGSGSSSGIYKSTDGGNTWELLTTKNSGFPTGKGVGRIGLALYSGKKEILYAVLDNQFKRKKKKEKYVVTKNLLLKISVRKFLKLNPKDLNDFLDRYNFPYKYNAAQIFKDVKAGKYKPDALVKYLQNANSQLFNVPVIGTEIYRSDNGGKTWVKRNKKYINGVFYSYGYYFGQIRVAPDNPNEIYVLGVPVLKSMNGGRTFVSITKSDVHADNHALWVSPSLPGHIILGNDGGLNISYDDGKTWLKANTPSVGQFYSVTYDMDKPFNVYGGMQDNGVWYGPSTNKESMRWYATGHYAFKSILGGDGMQVAVDTRDNKTVYAGFQFGNYFRIDKYTDKMESITLPHNIGQRPFRFNWETPICLSVHNQDILYLGSNYLHRSMDKGKTWQTISPDLTKGAKKGNVPYGTLTTIDESPLKFGLIYTGSDDGLIYVTKDGGNSWKKISNSLPQNYWITRVTASRYDTATVYASLNGYNWDNFDALLFRSTNYGNTWQRIGKNLPSEPVNVVKEDPVNKNILYVGTDHSVYVSLDKGKTFMIMNKDLPAVPVRDLIVQPRDKKLVIGTHGRSLYIADVEYVEQLTTKLLNEAIHFFNIHKITYSKNWGKRNFSWSKINSPEIKFVFYSKKPGETEITVKTENGIILKTLKDKAIHGLNYVSYNLTIDSTNSDIYKNYLSKKLNKKVNLKKADDGNIYLMPGKYVVEIKLNGIIQSKDLIIKKNKLKRRGEGKKFPVEME